MAINKHEIVEKNVGVLMVMICVAISFATLVEIVPLFFQKDLNEPVPGMKPLTALQLEGRDIYIREGCHVCHTQMIRPLRAETERYGHYSVAGESVWDHPFLWGSKRTGPDLARIGEKYSDDWQYVHLMNPRDVVPESNMPGFPWLAENKLDGELIEKIQPNYAKCRGACKFRQSEHYNKLASKSDVSMLNQQKYKQKAS